MSISEEVRNYIDLAVGKSEGRTRELLREHQREISGVVSGIGEELLKLEIRTNERIDERIHVCQADKKTSSRWLIGTIIAAVPLVSGLVAFLATHYR